MTFTDAIRSGCRRYFDFTSRSTRSEFWYWTLFVVIVSVFAMYLSAALSLSLYTLAAIFWLAILIPSIALTVRRLHDVGKSGWWVLVFYGVPPILLAIAAAIDNMVVVSVAILVSLVLIVIMIGWFLTGGDESENQWGPNPLSVS